MIIVDELLKDYRTNIGAGFLLDRVSFSLPPNKIIALVGTNGSGKSTILKILSGEIEADNGTILLNESNGIIPFPLQNKNILRTLYLDQESSRDLVPSMTVAENLYLALINGRFGSFRFPNRAAFRKRVKNVLSTIGLGLTEKVSQQVRLLSGGEKQGLVLARALLFKSKFLLLDEFVSALTHELASRFVDILKNSIRQEAGYCLFVTHEIDLVFKYADEFIFLHNGKILAHYSENSAESRKHIIELYEMCLRG